MEFARRAREAGNVVDSALGLRDELAQPDVIRGGGIDRGELRGAALDGALRIHDLADGDAGKVELHGERLGEQAGVAARNARAAPPADLDLDPALPPPGAPGVAPAHAAHPL